MCDFLKFDNFYFNFLVIESFRDYTEPETLEGDNLYDAGELGMQKAEKGVKFASFPPVLHLQLMRFQYDPHQDANVKINDRFEFPEVLQLNEFIDECGEQDDYTYLLQSVLVHTGDFHGGHYVVFINTNLLPDNPKWCKFDDDVVARCPTREAISSNFGGEDNESGRACSNAYMLVYVQQNKLNDVMCSVDDQVIPSSLKQRLENEKEEEAVRKREKEQATLFCDVYLITDEHLKDHHSFDIGEYENIKRNRMGNQIRIDKTSTARDFYEKVSSLINVPVNSFRLWKFGVVYLSKDEGYSNTLESRRPNHYIAYPGENDRNPSVFYDPKMDAPRGGDQIFYIELGTNIIDSERMTVVKTNLQAYNPESSIIVFLKFYNHHRRKFTYHGSFIMDLNKNINAYSDLIKTKLNLPTTSSFNLYLEVSPEHLNPIHPRDEITIKSDRHLIVDGAIIVAEDAAFATDDDNAVVHFNELFGRMQIEAIPNTDHFATNLNNSSDVVYITTQMETPLRDFCEALGTKLEYDPRKIVLWRPAMPADRPGIIIGQEEFNRYTVHDLVGLNGNYVHDPRTSRPYTIFYCKIPLLASKLDEHAHVRVNIMDAKFQTKEVSLFPVKDGSVKDILEAANEYVEFAPKGSQVLRLVHVSNTPSQSRIFQVLGNDLPIASIAQKILSHNLASSGSVSNLRVEEVPVDQVNLQANEGLLAVSHFEKEPNKMFGTPFFIKLVDGEPAVNLKKRVKQALEVNDRDFDKVSI